MNELALSILLPLSILATGADPETMPLEGVYDASHPRDPGDASVRITNYLVVDRQGVITAYTHKSLNPAEPGQGCYELAEGTATNAALQGRTLYPSVSAKGEPTYVAWAGPLTFGVVVEPHGEEPKKWFASNSVSKQSVEIIGKYNVAYLGKGPISITLPRLPPQRLQEIHQNICPPVAE